MKPKESRELIEFDPEIDQCRKDAQSKPLTDHQKQIAKMILGLSGTVSGFPDTPLKVRNLATAYAEFASTEPHICSNTVSWKNGIIPAQWLMDTIRRSCEWMPMPVAARAMYTKHFKPLDGIEMASLPVMRRESKSDE